MSDYDFDENFPFEEIKIKNLKPLQGGTFLASLELDEEPIVIQTPKCKTKHGIHKTSKTTYCDLLLQNDNLRLGDQLPSGIFSFNIPLIVGSFSSMLGIGGGTFNVTIMSLYGVSIHKAVGTSAGLGFFLSIPGTLFFVLTGMFVANLPPGSFGYVNLFGLLLIAPLAALSAPIGAKYAHSLPKKTLTRLFAVFLLLTSIRM